PRHRYATAAEMAWELEHPELVGVDGERRLAARGRRLNTRKLMLYAALALVPVALFVVMLLLARR
ncbi:MAG: hypothetical protein WBE74_15430, partial [Terracidiphilus sp.]